MVLALGAVVLSGCASMSRLMEYSESRESVRVDGQRFLASKHPDEQAVLLEVPFVKGLGAAFVEGLTLTAVDMEDMVGGRESVWSEAALTFLDQDACRVLSVERVADLMYEAKYECD